MVDTYVSGAYGEICVGSSPISDTIKNKKEDIFVIYEYATIIWKQGDWYEKIYF